MAKTPAPRPKPKPPSRPPPPRPAPGPEPEEDFPPKTGRAYVMPAETGYLDGKMS